jgi:hypothetical protein
MHRELDGLFNQMHVSVTKLKALAKLFFHDNSDGIAFQNSDEINGIHNLLDGIADELDQVEKQGAEIAAQL